MKHVQENLEQYRDKKFFSELQKRTKLYEIEDPKMKEEKKKNRDPRAEQDEKIAAVEEKDALNVIKKVKDNFNRFKSAAGGKIESVARFWKQQGEAITKLQEKDSAYKIAYVLYDSSYIVALKFIDGDLSLVIIDRNEGAIYSTSNETAINEFKSFISEMKNELKGVKDNYIKNVENKKREEEQKAKKEKLDKFLKESEEKKKQKTN